MAAASLGGGGLHLRQGRGDFLQIRHDGNVIILEPSHVSSFVDDGDGASGDSLIRQIHAVLFFHPRGAMSEKYGVYLADKGITGRAIAIVNKAGNVAWFKDYDIPFVPDLKDVAAALSQVKAATA